MHNLFCHFKRSVSVVEKSENVQFIPCHFERSEAKSKNLKTFVYATTRYFDLAQYDTVVAGITTQPLLCHFERSVSEVEKSKNN